MEEDQTHEIFYRSPIRVHASFNSQIYGEEEEGKERK